MRSSLSARRAAATIVVATALLAACVPATVRASTVTSSAGTFNYTAAPGEVNRLMLGFGVSLAVTDPGATIASEGECTTATPGQATCLLPVAEHGTFPDCNCEGSVSLGDGDDTLAIDPAPDDRFYRLAVDGGSGDDVLAGRSVNGGAGDDVLRGTAEFDTLVGGPGADVMDGLGGIDTVSYSDRRRGVRVSLDGRPNDGGPRERDAVRVEQVEGGEGPDVIVGDGASNNLAGNGGRDRVRGGAGEDRIDGGEGEDDLDGGAGDDELQSGDERVSDFRRPLAFDRIRCGGGEDKVALSPGDTVAGDCEHVYFAENAPNLAIGAARLRIAGGRVALWVANQFGEDGAAASGTLRLFAAGRDRSPAGVLGSARLRSLAGGRTAKLDVRLKQTARRVLARRGRLRLRPTLDARSGRDARSLTQRILTVTR